MNIFLLGNGGREHALAWKISQSYHCQKLFIAPGNAGTATVATNINISVNDFSSIKKICIENFIDILVVGPEDPLVNGIYNFLKEDDKLKNLVIVGASKQAAQLEGSKTFSKKFMQRHNIPTAAYAVFTKENFDEGKKYIAQHSLPIVLKADGLAAGKGVIIATSHNEALQIFEEMLINKQFGEASSKVVIEEFLSGMEVSVFVLTDGKNYQIIGHAKDYKRIGEGDTGLNTGGMGCVTPVPFVDDAFMQKVETKIIQPTINGLANENLVYTGFIFFGLMNVNNEPFVIEYNCRMGDPETEVVMPRLQTDLVALFAAMDNGTLADANISFSEKSFATVVAVSGGYPGEYKKNLVIQQFNNSTIQPSNNEAKENGSIIFHAGTKINNEGNLVTNGGRVLAVTSSGENISEAVAKSKKILQQISFEGMYFRKDIGYEFV